MRAAQLLNLRNPDLPLWPKKLRPIGESTFEKEPFSHWWIRHEKQLSNLDPQIAEQWVYRHWHLSHFSFMPLEELRWRLEIWSTAKVLGNVERYGHGNSPYTPAFDYDTFARGGGSERLPTAKALDQGTWDYPIIVLRTPNGFVDTQLDRPDARYVLIEGHQRMRYLNALHARCHSPLGPHKIFVLETKVQF